MTYTLRHKKGLAPQTIFFPVRKIETCSLGLQACSVWRSYLLNLSPIGYFHQNTHTYMYLFTLCYSSIRKPNSAFDIQRPRLPCISLPLYSGFTMAELNHSWRIWRTKEGEEGEECTKLNLTDKRLNGASSLIPHIWGIARPIFT